MYKWHFFQESSLYATLKTGYVRAISLNNLPGVVIPMFEFGLA